MLFHSREFFFLLSLLWLLYYLPILRKQQKMILLLGSFAFYSWENSHYLVLLATSAFWSSLCADRAQRSRTWLYLGVAGNLALLAFFKYANLLMPGLFTHSLEVSKASGLIFLPLPVGISFFTFQGISLVVDQSRDEAGLRPGDRVSRLLYIAFFPQLIAGPIVRARHFLIQLGPKTLGQINWSLCYRYLVLGFFFKRVVADNLKDLDKWFQYPKFLELSSVELATFLVAYSARIFADFAGYSLIAMGLAGLFGYALPMNFNRPYLATSFSDFWRRWHITLSQWLRDYLYIPLGGNRRGLIRTYANLMVVMALGGLWHGASWNYVAWGLAHGLFLVGEHPFRARIRGRWRTFAWGVLVYGLVTLAWLLFVLPTPAQWVEYVRAMARLPGPFNPGDLFTAAFFVAPVGIYHALAWTPSWKERLSPVIYGLLLFLITVESGTPGDFIYFQF